MSGPPPATIDFSNRQRALLEQLRQRQTAPQRLVRRVLILLTLAANPCLQTTARDLGLNRISVRLWRDRWLAAADDLAQAERDNLPDQQFLGLIAEILDDAPRPGGPATFSPEQIVQIVAVACEPPEKSGTPDQPLDPSRVGRRGQETPDRQGHRPTNRGAVLKDRPSYSPIAAATGSMPTRLTRRPFATKPRRCATCTNGPGNWPSKASTS